MSFLVDTNVVSELRKGDRANPGVLDWFANAGEEELFLSVLTRGELRKGIESVRRRDEESAKALERWLHRLAKRFEHRFLPIDAEIAEHWGRLNVPDPLPVVDGLLAATAFAYGLTLVTRNVGDVEATGVSLLNPFS